MQLFVALQYRNVSFFKLFVALQMLKKEALISCTSITSARVMQVHYSINKIQITYIRINKTTNNISNNAII